MKCLRQILKAGLLAGALLVLQACPPGLDRFYDELGKAMMQFTILSAETGDPIQNIRVSSATYREGAYDNLGTTDARGFCRVAIPYIRNEKGPYLRFYDPNRHFAEKDTLLTDLREREIRILLAPLD